MAYKKAGEAATKNGIAELAKRVPPNQALKFKDFQAKHAEYIARVNRQPEKLPNIDWEYYKRNVRVDFVKMVGEFEQKYKGVCEAFDKRHQQDKSSYFVEIDRLKKQVQEEVERYKAASNERIKALEAKYAQIQALIPYEEMTAEEYSELLPDKSFYRYNGEPSFWPHTPEEQGPGPSVKDAHGHGEGDGHGGGDDGHGGSGGSGSGSSDTSSAATAKPQSQSDAVSQGEQSVSPTPPPSKKEPVKTSGVKLEDVNVPCFESEQFKQDLEHLKKCFEESTTKPKKDAAENIKAEIINPVSISTESANVAEDKAVHIEGMQIKVFDPNRVSTTQTPSVLIEHTAMSSTQKQASHIDVASESVVKSGTKTMDLTESVKNTETNVEIKLDLPDLAKYLEEVTSKSPDVTDQRKHEELLLTTKSADKVESIKPAAIFMPFEPAKISKPTFDDNLLASRVSETTDSTTIESVVLEGLQVKVVGATEIISEAEISYPIVEPIQAQQKINETIDVDSLQAKVKEVTPIVVNAPKIDATKDMQAIAVGQSDFIAASVVSDVKEPIVTRFKAAEAISVKTVKNVGSTEMNELTETSQTLSKLDQSGEKAAELILTAAADSLQVAVEKTRLGVEYNAKVTPVPSAETTLFKAVSTDVAKTDISNKESQLIGVPNVDTVQTITKVVSPIVVHLQDVKPPKEVIISNEKFNTNEETMEKVEPKTASTIVLQSTTNEKPVEKIISKVEGDQIKSKEPTPPNVPDPKVVSSHEKPKPVEETLSKIEAIKTNPNATTPIIVHLPPIKSDENTKPKSLETKSIINTGQIDASKKTQVETITQSNQQMQPKVQATSIVTSKQLETKNIGPIEDAKLAETKELKIVETISAVIPDKVALTETKTKDISSIEKTKTITKEAKISKPTEVTSPENEPTQGKMSAVNTDLDEKGVKVTKAAVLATPVSEVASPITKSNTVETTNKEIDQHESNVNAIKFISVIPTNEDASKNLTEKVLDIDSKTDNVKSQASLIKADVSEKFIGPENKADQLKKDVGNKLTNSSSNEEHPKPATISFESAASILTTIFDNHVAKIINAKLPNSTDIDNGADTTSSKNENVQAILKSADSVTESIPVKSSETKAIITSEMANGGETKSEPIQAILKPTETDFNYKPESTHKKDLETKVIISEEISEKVKPIEAILKTTDSNVSSTNNDLKKKVIITDDIMESSTGTSVKPKAVEANLKANIISAPEPDSKKKDGTLVLKSKVETKQASKSSTIKKEKSANENIKGPSEISDKPKVTNKKIESKPAEKEIQLKVITSSDFFDEKSDTKQKLKSVKTITLKSKDKTSSDIIKSAEVTNFKVASAQGIIKAVDSIPNKKLEKVAAKTVDSKKVQVQANQKAVEVTSVKASKDSQPKVTNTGVKFETKTELVKPAIVPAQTTQKGFTLVGSPETIAVKSPEAEVARPSELFESVHLVQDQSNRDKTGDDAFSKTSKKDEPSGDESTKSVKAAKAES